MKVISDAAGQCHHIYPQFLPGTDRDVQGPWLAPSNATTLQLHIKYIWGNQPVTAVTMQGAATPRMDFSNLLMPSRTQKCSSFNPTTFQQQSNMLVQL